MRISDKKPPGLTVGYVRLHKRIGTHFQIVDLTRYELSTQLIRFREENWISRSGRVTPSSRGRNTDEFNYAIMADEYFAWWLKAKLEDGYAVLESRGSPGPVPQTA